MTDTLIRSTDSPSTAAEKRATEFFTHHGHGGRADAIGRFEQPPANEFHAERAEVPRTHRLESGALLRRRFDSTGKGLDEHPAFPAAPRAGG